MGRRKGRMPLIEGLEIVDAGSEGKAVGKYNDKIVFVPYVVPGDVVNAQVFRKRKNYLEAQVISVEKFSEKRIDPICEHFGTCGGCKWQNLKYEEQLFYKQKQVTDQLTRIGKIELPNTMPIVASPQTTFYRNKLEYTFSENKWITQEEMEAGTVIEEKRGVGFHIPGRFDKVLDIKECHLQSEFSNSVRDSLKQFAFENDLSFYNLREHQGLFRNLIVRNTNLGETMVLVSFGENNKEQIERVMDHLKATYPEITSLQYVINEKKNDTIYDLDIQLYAGKDFITEEMEGLKFKIGAKSFFQTNSTQALKLYEIARDFANISDSDVVYDLYTGTGTIANFVARSAKKVVGVESVPEAIEDAKVNSRENGISNTTFYAGDMKDILNQEFFIENGQPDVIITDPPRAGMHPKVVSNVLNSGAKTIVYVSCNAASQARDLQLLDEKYRVTRVQPVDMFPHTHHVENVALLELK
ncbi:MAG: 23S rRNA (uracil(1939)-C(5))-methyltransferase RlmD [Crocinitomicaceae bacterium]|nr:23S rRNA (uracil(1939)-C(5))-methyltransferase RlmD [Crocinitomicaceae bacterium]